MIKWKLELITTKDINEFVRVAEKYKEDLIVTNSTNTFRVSAKSLMGMLYTTEWGNDVYLVQSEIWLNDILTSGESTSRYTRKLCSDVRELINLRRTHSTCN